MTTTLSKSNPPQVGDRLVHNGAVCTSIHSRGACWRIANSSEDFIIYSYLEGREVERADEPIRVVTDASRAWGIRPIDDSNAQQLFNLPDGIPYFLVPETEYNKLKGEG